MYCFDFKEEYLIYPLPFNKAVCIKQGYIIFTETKFPCSQLFETKLSPPLNNINVSFSLCHANLLELVAGIVQSFLPSDFLFSTGTSVADLRKRALSAAYGGGAL